jgi:hypothetical protein
MHTAKSVGRRRRTRKRRVQFFTPLLVESLEQRALLALAPQPLTDVNLDALGLQTRSAPVEINGLAYFAANDELSGFGPTGRAADGEVEDHLVTITQDLVVDVPAGALQVGISKSGSDVAVFVDLGLGAGLFTSPLAFTRAVIVRGSGTTADDITVDYASGGFFSVPGGIQIDGGAGAGGGDRLTVQGTPGSLATTARYVSAGLALGNATLEMQEGAAVSVIQFENFEPLSVNDVVTLEVDGVLNVGGDTLTVAASTLMTLGTRTNLGGGTIIAPRGVALHAGQSVRGTGAINGRIAAEAGSTIEATGALMLGDPLSPAGFFSRGELRANSQTVTLLDANQAVLGSLTNLGNAGLPGTLVSANGAVVDFGGNVIGFGMLTTPNDVLKPLMNNGLIQGTSAAERITLGGYVRGVGGLDNVTISGTGGPGFSPAAVYYGSATFDPAATLVIELAGTTAGSGYDQVNFSGTAGLNGTLRVELLDGFVPAIGNSFAVLTSAGGISGSFTAIAFPPLPADRKWALSVTANEVRLSVVPSDLVNPWHNLLNSLDVDGDTFISPIDAVLVINYLNAGLGGAVPDDAAVGPPFFDVDDDRHVSPIDAVLVINWLNAHPVQSLAGAAAGEDETLRPAIQLRKPVEATAADAIFAWDLWDQPSVRKRRGR